MDKSIVDAFLMENSKNLPEESLGTVRQRLLETNDEQEMLLQMTNLRNPILVFVVSLLGGCLGIDRFVIGDTMLGVLKLITCGGIGIWAIIDWFLIIKITKQKNLEQLTTRLGLGLCSKDRLF